MTVKTVVIAAHEIALAERFADALTSAEHRAIVVTKYEALVEQLVDTSNRIDLVILDLQLGTCSGPSFVQSIKKFERCPPVLIFSSSVTSNNEARQLANIGVVGYINERCPTQQILSVLAPHLSPDSFNRRGSPRVSLGIPVSYAVGDSLSTATTLNLSKGGIAIRAMTSFKLSSKARIRFRLPGTKREIEADARVVWTDQRGGMGLQFERVDAADQVAIDGFLDRYFDSATA